MLVGIAFVLVYLLIVGFLLFRYERPKGGGGKMSGRGGDFSE